MMLKLTGQLYDRNSQGQHTHQMAWAPISVFPLARPEQLSGKNKPCQNENSGDPFENIPHSSYGDADHGKKN